jgi:hypothetical protein
VVSESDLPVAKDGTGARAAARGLLVSKQEANGVGVKGGGRGSEVR